MGRAVGKEEESSVLAGARPSRGLSRTTKNVDYRRSPSLHELLTLVDCPPVQDPAALAQWLHTRGVSCRWPRWRVYGLPQP